MKYPINMHNLDAAIKIFLQVKTPRKSSIFLSKTKTKLGIGKTTQTGHAY